jgi:hypothetical protein
MVALTLGGIMLNHSFPVQHCQESEQAPAGVHKMTLESKKEALQAALADLSFRSNLHQLKTFGGQTLTKHVRFVNVDRNSLDKMEQQ